MLVRLAHHHPDTVLGNLRNINMSLMKQAKNLRSQVSRAAIQAFTCFFDTLKRNMESVSILKAKFLCYEVGLAFSVLMQLARLELQVNMFTANAE